MTCNIDNRARTSAGARTACPGRRSQRGLTLVELMVSVGLALLVTLAALATLLFSRQSGNAMEQSTALRDNARFGTELIRRIVQQAGFESFSENSSQRQVAMFTAGSAVPDVEGFNNALVAAGTDPAAASNGNRSAGCGTVTDTSCMNGSDVLIVRYQGLADGSMINCAGAVVGDAATATDRPMSAFHIRRNLSGEPTLVCTYRDSAAGTFEDRHLIEGVESFQVLYGVDGVTPNAATTATTAATTVTRYLRADEMVVVGDAAATRNNWRRVRSIRIGMVVRGARGSSIVSAAENFFPLGQYLASANDAFSTFVTPADGRLRQAVTFTVHLRNYLGA